MTTRRPLSRIFTIATLSLTCAVTAVPQAAAQDAARGAALLAEARTALGGADKLSAVKTIEMKSDFKRSLGQNTMEGELELRLALPDKLRRDEDTSLPGGGPAIVRTEVLNGSQVWEENSGNAGMFMRRGGGFGGGGRGQGGGAQAGADAVRGRGIDPAQLEELQRRARQTDLARLTLIWLLMTDQPVAWVGTAQAPDGVADVLEIGGSSGPAPQEGPGPRTGTPVRLFLDQSSHIPLMLTWQGAAPQVFRGGRGRGGAPAGDQPGPGRPGPSDPPTPRTPATLQMTLSDYKTVNGIKLPHLITRGANGQTMEEWSVSSSKLNPSFKADVFNK